MRLRGLRTQTPIGNSDSVEKMGELPVMEILMLTEPASLETISTSCRSPIARTPLGSLSTRSAQKGSALGSGLVWSLTQAPHPHSRSLQESKLR